MILSCVRDKKNRPTITFEAAFLIATERLFLLRRENLVHACTADRAGALGCRASWLDLNFVYILHFPLLLALYAITDYFFVHFV